MSETSRSNNNPSATLQVYRNGTGSWAVLNEDRSRGGLFVSYEAAVRFVKDESLRSRNRVRTQPSMGKISKVAIPQ
jgi:hypothetical protein